MRLLKILLILAFPVVLIMGCQKMDSVQDENLTLKSAVTGNGAPSGTHYNLNIIGVPKGKTADMTNNNGGRIFVSLGKSNDGVTTKIMLTPAPAGESFKVLDANGTDGTAAFQLPADVSATYNVWARALGTPGGHVVMTTCAEGYVLDGIEYAVTLSCGNPLELTRTTGKGGTKFTDVSDHLLFVTLTEDVVVDGVVVVTAGTYPLFSEELYGYFWDYDNYGLKLLQLRFYPKPIS
jgi:hypothetical protein